MFNKREIEQKIAKFLLQIKAIKIQPDNPFTWASGWKSPVYCDNRITLSHPSIRTYIRQKLTELVQEEYGSVAIIAGVATAGIPQGALVAQELGLPFIYVRSTPSEHADKMIEGEFFEGQRVVVIEDLISTGTNSVRAIETLREAKCEVAGLVGIFSYGLDIAEQNFKDVKCRVSTLLNYDGLVEYAADNALVSPEDLKLLYQWRENPIEWSKLALT